MTSETYEVSVRGRFSAVHQLRLADGGTEPLHGHDWKVEAIFRGPKLDALDMLIDFELAIGGLRTVLAKFDRGNLNMLPRLAGSNPTAEFVARLVFDELRDRLGPQAPLAVVRVEEAPGCVASYARIDS